MANQISVNTGTGNQQVTVTTTGNIQVTTSRSVIGTVANVLSANYANYAGQVTGANQSNITTVGTLGNLSVSGTATVGNMVVTGNLQVGNLIANNANYSNFAGIAFNVAGANVSGEVANANYATNSGLATYATTANSVAGANVSGYVANATHSNIADVANSVAGANVSGQVSFAAVANSVAVANVSGIGNIAVTNYDGNGSNILHGNGFWGPESGSLNANYANFAGEAFSVNGSNVNGAVGLATYATTANAVAGANVSGAVNLATYATTANSVAGANVSGIVANANYSAYANIAATANSVAVANVSGIGNIAVINLDGNASNILYGNGVFGPDVGPQDVANANYANFAGTAYSVSGANVSGQVSYAAVANSVAGANVSGTVANATYATDSGHATVADSANSVAGANVSGQVGNALVAGTVYTNAQPNITSTGNLVSLTINNGNVELPTKQFTPNGITVGSTANITLMANSSFVDVDYGNGQGGGNLRFGKSTSYVKARGNATTIATAAVNDVAGRTNYMFYNGTSNVLAAATQTNVTTFNANANAITTAGQYQIITGNPSGDQGNANALSNQNLYTFDSAGRLSITAGAAGGAGSILLLNTYGGTSGGAAAASQGVIFTRTRGNRDSNLSVQPSDQLGYFSFLGHNGTSLFTTRSASLQALVDSSYTANTTAIPAGFKVTSASSTAQNDNWFYANGNVRFGLQSASNSAFQTDATVFVNNFDSAGNVANVAGNLNVGSAGANLITLTGSTGYITYNRTYGDFYNTSTITPAAANTPAVLPLGVAGTANNCSIQSTSQLLISRVGNYNMQFSLQAVNADNSAEHDFYVWLRKNGSDVTNSATDYTVIKNNGKTVAMLTFNVSSNGSDYYEIAYAVNSTQITFPAYAANSQGFTHPAIPSLIVNLIPIGA